MNSLQQLSSISKLLATPNHQKSDIYAHYIHSFRNVSDRRRLGRNERKAANCSVGLLQCFFEAKNGVDHDLISQSCVQEGVISVTVWPFDLKVSLNERPAFAIDGVYQALHLVGTHAIGRQTAHLLVLWGIEENAQRVLSITQEML